MPEPVTVSVEVKRPRQEVFEYVDAIGNRGGWLKNMYKDWRYEGPKRGVGATARAQVDAPTASEKVEIKVVESTAPERIVEEIESAHGKRQARGTYRFAELDGGRTRIDYEYAWLATPKTERWLPFVSRRFMSRAQGRSLKLLQGLLEKS